MLPYDNRLVKRKDFEKIYKFGNRSFAGNVSLKFLENNLENTRIGIVVGLKFSKKAVARNTAKRKMREILRKNLGKIKKGYDVAIFLRPEREGQDHVDSRKLENNLAEAFEKARLIKE